MNKASDFARLLRARPIAHRGLHDYSMRIVENTPSAFAGAITGNYTIECDLQISGDGEAMVFHDHDLGRLTEQTNHVNSLSADQLKNINFKNTDDKMQTLQELLAQVNGKVPLVIELKSLVDGDMTLAKRTIEVLSDYAGPYGLMSFGPMLLLAIKELSPQTPRGGVVSPDTEHLWLQMPTQKTSAQTMLEHVNPDFLSYDVRGLPSEFVWKFKSDTKPVICWTVKDQKTADFGYKHCDQITFEGFKPK